MDNNLSELLRGIPTLTTTNFVQWLCALTDAARYLDCHRVLLGYDREPYRARRETYDRFVSPPGSKAGDHPPITDLKPESLGNGMPLFEQVAKCSEIWQMWAAREGKARYLVLHSVGPSFAGRIRDIWSSHDMIRWLSDTFSLPIKGHEVDPGYKLQLPNSPTTDEMTAHFKKFLARSEQDRAAKRAMSWEKVCQTFVFTLSQPLAIHMELFRLGRSYGSEKTWEEMSAEYLSISDDPSPFRVAAGAPRIDDRD